MEPYPAVTLATPGATTPTVFFTRGPALMHVAIYEALNSFDRGFTPYLDRMPVPYGASRDAAVAQAAHDTLAAMYPTQIAVYDAALAAQLDRLPAAAAKAALASAPRLPAPSSICAATMAGPGLPAYVLPSMAGYWQPAPPANAAARSRITPMSPPSSSAAPASSPGAPPALTSQRYADDFNEVKAIGGVASTTRTADQTLVARLFAPCPP